MKTKLEAEDVAKLFVQVSKFLVKFLNLGNFEGASGAKTNVVMRLTLALNMIILLRHAHDDKRLAISEMFSQCQDNAEMRSRMEEGMDNLLLWLFLNARSTEDEQYLAPLANSTLQTPATFYVKQITSTV